MPAAGYEIDFLRRPRPRPRQPAEGRRRGGARGRAAVPAARRRCARAAPMRSWAAAATWPGPAGLAALSLRLPLVLTEADRHLGLANRLLARRARRVCLAFPIEGREGDRYLVTGRPVPGGRSRHAGPRGGAASASASPPIDRCLLVFGGSQGARSINALRARRVHRRWPGARERDFHVLHIARQPRLPAGPRARSSAAGRPDALHAARVRARPGRRARRLRPGARPRRRLGVRDGRRRAAGDPRPLSARGRRATSTPTPPGWPTRARRW